MRKCLFNNRTVYKHSQAADEIRFLRRDGTSTLTKEEPSSVQMTEDNKSVRNTILSSSCFRQVTAPMSGSVDSTVHLLKIAKSTDSTWAKSHSCPACSCVLVLSVKSTTSFTWTFSDSFLYYFHSLRSITLLEAVGFQCFIVSMV